eukprot:5926792-Heterocapsa_arctica.AAC.1
MWVLPERPDLSFIVRELARKVISPTEHDQGRLKRVLRYIKGTQDLELYLSIDDSSSSEVISHVDASWASGLDRRSVSGGAIWSQGFLLQHWS